MAKRKSSTADPVTAYARAVQAGGIIASRMVRLATERHLRDLAEQAERGLVWKVEKALDVIRFFEEVLCLPDVETDDDEVPEAMPFLLNGFQKFILGSLFGWHRADGLRRFRVAYIETGKGSGKSPTAAGIALYGLVVDGGIGAQIYSAAVTEKQAKIPWVDADRMVKASAELADLVDQKVNNLSVLETGAFFRPVSSEKRGLDGKRVFIAIIEELHEHPDGTVVDKMRAGTKGRKNALIVEITNSGYDRQSVCWQHHEYSRQVLQGTIRNDAWFAFVCHLDSCDTCYDAGHLQPTDKCAACDHWDVEGPHWEKANPNLGRSLTWDYLREQVQEARGMPAKRNIVRRLNFCQWTQQHTAVVTPVGWKACQRIIDWTTYDGREAWLGLDLANTTDIAAAIWLFPEEDGSLTLLPRFWVPREGARARSEKDLVPYLMWIADGHLTATEGNVTDYEVVRRDLNVDGARFVVKEGGFDPWNATQLATQLGSDGFLMVQVRQGFASLSEPTKHFLGMIKEQKINHDGNPVLGWMMTNLVVAMDAAGNQKPDKSKATEKIDGAVAAVIAVSRFIVQPGETAGSVYETRGVWTL